MSERKQGRRSAQQAEETKQLILVVATEMFCEQGFERVSLRSISERAGVSHSLIRHHFGSKEKIWYAISDGLHDYMQRYIRHILQNMPAGIGPNAKLYQLTVRLLAFMLSYPQPIQLIADAVRHEGALFDYFISKAGDIEQIVFDIADEHNEACPENPANIEEMKWLMIMFAHGAASLKPFLCQAWGRDKVLTAQEGLLCQWNMYENMMAQKLKVEDKDRLKTEQVIDLVYDVSCFNREHNLPCAFEERFSPAG